jgi:hypothetical protein
VAATAVSRPVSLCIGRHSSQGWDAHAAGLQTLARELGATGRTLDIRDVSLGPDIDSADVIYLTGHSRLNLGPDERAALSRAVDRGAVVIGDGCAAGPRGDAGARDFSVSFTQVFEELGRHLESVTRGHPALSGRHLFALVPPGGRESTVLLGDASGAALCCDGDYGCAWSGGAPDKPLSRGAIRDALELGVNFVTLDPSGKQ